MVGTILHGIHIIFHPLLVLTADQIVKFETGSNIYGAIEVHNHDEQALKSIQFQGKLLSRLEGLAPDSTTAIFVFTSPQFLTKYQAFSLALYSFLGRTGHYVCVYWTKCTFCLSMELTSGLKYGN